MPRFTVDGDIPPADGTLGAKCGLQRLEFPCLENRGFSPPGDSPDRTERRRTVTVTPRYKCDKSIGPRPRACASAGHSHPSAAAGRPRASQRQPDRAPGAPVGAAAGRGPGDPPTHRPGLPDTHPQVPDFPVPGDDATPCGFAGPHRERRPPVPGTGQKLPKIPFPVTDGNDPGFGVCRRTLPSTRWLPPG